LTVSNYAPGRRLIPRRKALPRGAIMLDPREGSPFEWVYFNLGPKNVVPRNVYDFLRDAGVSDKEAEAMVANAMRAIVFSPPVSGARTRTRSPARVSGLPPQTLGVSSAFPAPAAFRSPSPARSGSRRSSPARSVFPAPRQLSPPRSIFPLPPTDMLGSSVFPPPPSAIGSPFRSPARSPSRLGTPR
jgi:hypothetical protein